VTTAAESAHELRARVRTHLDQERSGWVPLAAVLHAVHAHEAWRELGADSWAEWLAQEDIGRSHGYTMVAAWEVFGRRGYDLEGLDVSKLALVVQPAERGAVSPVQALSDVRTLSRSDLRTKYGTRREREDEEVELCLTCGQPLPR
jgi:hypothetical protein